MSCSLCPRLCRNNRFSGEEGFCLIGHESSCYKEYLHFGEEKILIPSHTVFLSGCNMRCVFCSDNKRVLSPEQGFPVSGSWIARRILKRHSEGSINVNFAGGEPCVNIYAVIDAVLNLCRNSSEGLFQSDHSEFKMLLNSNMYFNPFLVDILDGIIDGYIADLKFGNDECAFNIAQTAGYLETVVENMRKISEKGKSFIIIRHLALPGHLSCCTIPVMEIAAKEFGSSHFNLMLSYVPFQRSKEFPHFSRMLTEKERGDLKEIFYRMNFKKGMIDGIDACIATNH
jgi:putative pyruvate formate lyase activating enzyme